MMKFFRKIRQRLLAENKFSKYLFYAIGEIILVVIGILIAVSINNWKNSIAVEKAEQNLYHDIIQELHTDLDEIQGNRTYNQKYLLRYKRASEIILKDTKKELIDTLAIITTELTNFSDFQTEGLAYEMLSASGKLDLITNKIIINKLQNLGILYNYINRLEKNQEQFMFTIVPKISEYLRFNPLKIMHPEELYTYKFQNDIEILINLGIEKDGLYEQCENDLINLIHLLDDELK